MSTRALIALAAVVVVLTLLAVLGGRDDAPAGSQQGAVFLPALAAALDDIERVTVRTAGEMPAATLERRGGEWGVVEKDGYAADIGKLRAGLRALAEARILELKTANAELHSRLGVEDVAGEMAKGIAMSFTVAGGSVPTVILGNTEGTKYRYARRADEAQSYLLDRDPELPRSASQWLDADIVDVRSDRVQQVTITHPDETVAISKATRADANFAVANVPEGRELLYAGVANVVGNALRELKLEDVAAAAAEPAAGAEAVVVELRTFDGLVLTVRGVEDGDESWLTFAAAYDADQAAQFAAAAETDDGADAQPAAAVGTAEARSAEARAPPAAADIMAEAERINARTNGWRYRIASYQYDQLTRRMSDLLKPPPSDGDGDDE